MPEVFNDFDLGDGKTLNEYIYGCLENGANVEQISHYLSLDYGLDIEPKVLRKRINKGSVGKMKTIRFYCCPKCGGNQTTSTMQIPHIDDIVRKKSCHDCGYQWQTVEIDIDLYNSVAFGRTEVEEIDLRGRRNKRNTH